MGRTYTAKQFIDAIPGTGGIISAIASKVGCSWSTAKIFIDEYPTVKVAYEAETESLLDDAESLLTNNIKFGLKEQREIEKPVDSADAKWLLSRKGKLRGWADKQEIEHSGEMTQRITGIDDTLKKAWGNEDNSD